MTENSDNLNNLKSVKFSNFQKRLIDEKPGIYFIRYLENESPKKFTRLNGTDKEGTSEHFD